MGVLCFCLGNVWGSQMVELSFTFSVLIVFVFINSLSQLLFHFMVCFFLAFPLYCCVFIIYPLLSSLFFSFSCCRRCFASLRSCIVGDSYLAPSFSFLLTVLFSYVFLQVCTLWSDFRDAPLHLVCIYSP